MTRTRSNSSLSVVGTDNSTLSVPDNISLSQKKNLDHIVNKSISDLVNGFGIDTSSLLVFPDSLEKYDKELGKKKILTSNNGRIETGNILGHIGFNGISLKIRSRFDNDNKDFFMHYMLKKVFAINLFDLPHETDDKDEVFDFLPFLFPERLNDALNQGIYKKYNFFHRNDANIRGPIDVAEHMKNNLPFTGRISYKLREHAADNNLTELIRHAIEVIRRKPFAKDILDRDKTTKTNVASIIQATSNYKERDRWRILYKNLRPDIHPYYYLYEPLRMLCVKILMNEEIQYGQTDDTVYGILFDGAWLWEEYLNTILKKCKRKFFHPNAQISDSQGFPSIFINIRSPRYPDFYNDRMILDAKYKDITIDRIDRDDLAQVISYMYINKSTAGGLIVPGKQDTDTIHKSLRINGYGGTFHLLALPISKASNFKLFCKEMERNESYLITEIDGIKYGQDF